MADNEGIQVEVADGFARIEFLDRSRKGPTLERLRSVGGTSQIKLDTGGTKRTYIVPEHVAVAAGLADPGGDAEERSEAPKKASPRKAAAKPAAQNTES